MKAILKLLLVQITYDNLCTLYLLTVALVSWKATRSIWSMFSRLTLIRTQNFPKKLFLPCDTRFFKTILSKYYINDPLTESTNESIS